ncbi:MAG: hypothetical protein KIT31_06770 [Deltaproteobacteria bacterium]|nr:hypothetical protein [Deltaproteobacteria bacterium]
MHRLAWIAVLTAACGRPAGGTLPAEDPCALPGGVVLADLEPRAGNILLRRALVCRDHANGRIGDGEYGAQVAALDAELASLRHLTAKPRRPDAPFDASLIDWATTVIDVSTQYTDTAWSAKQVLGPPNVYPAYGDNDKAWASLGADDRDEFIEVGFAHAGSISGVEVVETYNPGAIDQVELITATGRRIDVPVGTAPAASPNTSQRRTFRIRCTREKIVSVRIHLDSQRVSGWNELDAIGVHPCTP